MSLWGAAPVLLVALLGGAGQTSDATPTTLASTSAVLAQTGAHTWQTTVQLNNVGTSCPQDKTSYVLETSRPDRVYGASQVDPVMAGSGYKSPPKTCVAVTVTFSGLPQAPGSAVLEFGAGEASASSVQLTVSRNITLIEYLVVPLITGVVMVALLVLLILLIVRIYDWNGLRIAPFRYQPDPGSPLTKKRLRPDRDFWTRSVSATGAWTVNDSWATNIATVVALLATVLTTTTAANSLFPGVPLDRFSLVNVAAGVIVAAVPLAFGIAYAWWIDRDQGITNDSLIAPTMEMPADCEVELHVPTTVTYRPERARLPRWLVQGQPLLLPGDGRLTLRNGGNRCLATAHGPSGLLGGTHVILLAGTAVTHPEGPARTTLHAALEVKLAEGTRVARGFGPWVRIPAGERVTIGDGTKVTPGLAAGRPIILPDGAMATVKEAADFASPGIVNWADRTVTLLGGKQTSAILRQGADDAPAGTQVTLPSGVSVTVCDPAQQAAPAQPVMVEVKAPAGAVLTTPGGAIMGPGPDPGKWSTLLKDGGKIQVPLQSVIKIHVYPGGVVALPGGSDVVVTGESYFEITSCASVLPVAGDEQGPGLQSGAGKDGPPDANLEFPVYGTGPAGGKITVTGTAEIRFPAQMALTTPRRDDFIFKNERHVTIPQASGTLIGNMWLVIGAALMTMFGVGAEIGIAGTLAFLSDATTIWQWVVVVFLGAVAAFTVSYGATAIRSLADPQPGSSLSGTPGTSFTL
jgi:hypothetical protein